MFFSVCSSALTPSAAATPGGRRTSKASRGAGPLVLRTGRVSYTHHRPNETSVRMPAMTSGRRQAMAPSEKPPRLRSTSTMPAIEAREPAERADAPDRQHAASALEIGHAEQAAESQGEGRGGDPAERGTGDAGEEGEEEGHGGSYEATQAPPGARTHTQSSIWTRIDPILWRHDFRVYACMLP